MIFSFFFIRRKTIEGFPPQAKWPIRARTIQADGLQLNLKMQWRSILYFDGLVKKLYLRRCSVFGKPANSSALPISHNICVTIQQEA